MLIAQLLNESGVYLVDHDKSGRLADIERSRIYTIIAQAPLDK